MDRETDMEGTYHTTIGDHPDHQSTPFPLFALGTKLEDMSTVRSEGRNRHDLGPALILAAQFDLGSLAQLRLGKGDTKDGRLGALVTAKVRRIDIDIMHRSEIAREADDHPTQSYQRYAPRTRKQERGERGRTDQSKEGLCRLDSQPSYNAPVGPNWPFIEMLGCSSQSALVIS